MTDALTHCRWPMKSLLLLIFGSASAGFLVGASVALGLCAVAYLIHR